MIDQTMRRHLAHATETILKARNDGMIPEMLPGEPASPLDAVNKIADELTFSGNPSTAEKVTVRLPSGGLEFHMSRMRPVRPRTGALTFTECLVMLVLSECGWRLCFPLIEMKGGARVSALKGGIVWQSGEHRSGAYEQLSA